MSPIENIPRRDRTLNEIIDHLNQPLLNTDPTLPIDARVSEAWGKLSGDEIDWIAKEVKHCLDSRYFLENYYCIRTENGFIKTMYPFWDHQEIVEEAIVEEQAGGGQCLIIVLKPRQAGISTWISAKMFHRTVMLPHAFTLTMAHDKEASTNIYKMMWRAYELMPWWMKPGILFNREGDYIEFQNPSEKDRITNPGLGSTIQIANAQRITGVAIGRTIRNWHGCLSSKNQVVDEQGYLHSIADARVGDRVLIEHGKTAAVTAFSDRAATEIYPGADEGYRITPWCNAAFPIEGTGNHKILCAEVYQANQDLHKTIRSKNPEWNKRKRIRNQRMTELREITLKHSLVIPVTPITSDGQLPPGESVGYRKHGGGRINSWNPPKPDREFGFACGLFLAEGNLSHRNLALFLDLDERHLADRFAKAVGVEYKTGKPRISRTRVYEFNRSSMRDWFAKHLGHKDQKHIPRWAWSLGREFLAGIVEGLIVGDGHNEKTAAVSIFTSTRAHLALATREAVCSLGHGYGGILTRPAGRYYGRNCQQIWIVKFGHEVDESMRKEYNWPLSSWTGATGRSHARYSADKTEIIVNIRKIERVLLDRVYDIEVDTPEHTFMLPGALTHNSEAGKWPENAGLFTSDIEPSMNAKDEFGVIESTAFGRNGFFYNHWRGSVNGDTGWRPVFIPVYRVKKYFLPIKANEVFELTDEEQAFTDKVLKEDKIQIRPEFWKWRRKRIRSAVASTGAPWEHYEAYPITPDEAFQSSGVCAFDRTSLQNQQMRNVCKPLWVGEISLAEDDHTPNIAQLREIDDEEEVKARKGSEKLVTHDRLWVWAWPEPGENYYVSSDSGLGVVDGDYSVCEVFRVGTGRDPDEQVAEWWGHENPKGFARINAALGYWYIGHDGPSEVATEYQGPGITTGDELTALDYPNLYRPRHKDRVSNQLTPYFHWLTTIKTRDPIITNMNEALLSNTVQIRSKELIDEMYDFGSLGGRFEGQGNNDDGTMASMIGLYCLRETFQRILPVAAGHQPEAASGDIRQWAVYDHLSRMRGQYNSQAEAERMLTGRVNWRVQPVMICQANTLYSPIYDGNGAESDLRFRHGMSSTDILPDVVNAYKTIMGGGGRKDFSADDEW